MLGPGPVLPEIDSLPGADQQTPASEGQGEGGAGEGRADVGGHVIRAFVVVAVRAQFAPTADRSHPLLGHQGLEVGGQIHQHPRVGVLVDSERAAGMFCENRTESLPHFAPRDLGIERLGDVGEAFAGGLE